VYVVDLIMKENQTDSSVWKGIYRTLPKAQALYINVYRLKVLAL
jgi:hypothetical protein